MTKNLYYEYRKWNLFWGLTLDQETEIQSVIDEFNLKGWKVKDFEWSSMPKLPLLQLLKVIIITTITLGFCSYWVGFSIIFESTNDLAIESNNPNEPKNQNSNSDSKSILTELKTFGIISETEYNERISSLEIDKTLNEHLNKVLALLNQAKNTGVLNDNDYNNKVNKIVSEETAKLKEWQKSKPTVADIPANISNQLPEHLKEQLIQKMDEFSDYYFASKFVLVQAKNKFRFIQRDQWDKMLKDGESSNYVLIYMKK
jgi:hypothetical protein